MGTTSRILLCFTPLLLALSCSDPEGSDPDKTGQKGCPGNTNIEPAAATELAAGKEVQGYLCPVGNQHWFKIQVPQGQPVIAVDLHNDTTLSAVKLSYVLRGADGETVIDQSPPPPQQSNVKQSLKFSHCVPQAGTYYLQVRSFSDSGADTRNPFTLSYTTAANPDPNKPQNATAQGATAVTGMDQTGYVACKGDRSFYKITVPDGSLLDIQLRTAAPTPNLALKYTVLNEQMELVAEDGVPNGMAATNLQVVRVAPKVGAYYIVVSDQASGSDLKTPFTLRVKALPEPDPNERPSRNDIPDNATDLGTLNCAGGQTSKNGFLASRADVDWFKVRVTGASPSCILEVGADWRGQGQAIRPQITYVYPDNANTDMTINTPCTKDEECRVLKRACGTDDNRCEYAGNQCNKQEGKCTGASVCLPEKFCGVAQYAKGQTDMGTPALVRTSQPLSASGIYYIRVRDVLVLGYDTGASYTLSLRATTDTGEPNNFYSPYVMADNATVRNASFIMKNKIRLGTPVSGKVSFEKDQDFYVFDHPCPLADCTLKVTYSSQASSRGVYFTYQVEADGRLTAGWPAPPAMRMPTSPAVTNQVFGNGVDTCFYASKRHTGPYFLWVSDLIKGGVGPLWDLDATYTLNVEKVMDGCSPLCANMFNCGK